MSDQPQKTKQQLLDELESIMSMLDGDSVIPTLDTVVEPHASGFQSSEPPAEPDHPSPTIELCETAADETSAEQAPIDSFEPALVDPEIKTQGATAPANTMFSQADVSSAEVVSKLTAEVEPIVEPKIEAAIEIESETINEAVSETQIEPQLETATEAEIKENPKSSSVDYSQHFKPAIGDSKAPAATSNAEGNLGQSSNPFKPSLLKGEAISPASLPGQQQLFDGTNEPEETIAIQDKPIPAATATLEHSKPEALDADKPSNPFKTPKLSDALSHAAEPDVSVELESLDLDSLSLDNLQAGSVELPHSIEPSHTAELARSTEQSHSAVPAETVVALDPELEPKPIGLEPLPDSDLELGLDLEPLPELAIESAAPEAEALEPANITPENTLTYSEAAPIQSHAPALSQNEIPASGLMPLSASAVNTLTPSSPQIEIPEEQLSDSAQIIDELVAQYLPQIEAELRQRLLAALDDDELDF